MRIAQTIWNDIYDNIQSLDVDAKEYKSLPTACPWFFYMDDETFAERYIPDYHSLMKNLVYSEDTKSFVKRLAEKWKDGVPDSNEVIEEDAFAVMREFFKDLEVRD